MKKHFTTIAAAFLFAALGFASAHLFADGVKREKLVVQTKAGQEHIFHVEIADEPAELERGLMFRKEMDEDHGMLFEFQGPPRAISFWMKNTYIPLDMVFVGADGDIVHVAENTVPLSLSGVPSVLPVTAVIELNGGVASKLGITAGDKVVHPFFKHP